MYASEELIGFSLQLVLFFVGQVGAVNFLFYGLCKLFKFRENVFLSAFESLSVYFFD